MTVQTLFHSEGFLAVGSLTFKGALLLVEGQDVVLQVEGSGVGPVAALSWTLEHNSFRQVNLLVLLKEPGVLELLIALVAQDHVLVVTLVLKILCPGFSDKGTAFLFARITFMHLLMTFQFAGHWETLLTAFKVTLERQEVGVFILMDFKLVILLEGLSTATVHAHIQLVLVLVLAKHMLFQVGFGGERVFTSIMFTLKRLVSAVRQLVSGKVEVSREAFTTAFMLTHKGFLPGVLAHVCLQLPRLVKRCITVLERANEVFNRNFNSFSHHVTRYRYYKAAR